MLRDLWRRGAGAARATLLLATMLGGSACERIVEYEERDVIPPDALNTAAGAAALYAAAVRSFGRTFAGDAGGTEGMALISGMMSDEFFHSGTFSTRVDYDMRSHFLDNSTLLGVYRFLNTARLDANRAIVALSGLEGNSPATDPRIGQMYNNVGAVFLFAAMNYCNGIVFSSIVDGVTIYGQQITNLQALDSADAYFDLALVAAPGTGDVNHHTARLMKARAMMLRGPASYAAAAALAAQVPTEFVAINEHSTINGGTENGIFVFNTQNERWSIAHLEGGNGLPFRGAGDGTDPDLADPRVPWARTLNPDGSDDVGFDNGSPQYDLLLYTGRADPSVWGTGIEARLIEAEADLAGGDNTGWLDGLNALRSTVPGLAALADPGTAAGRVDLMFRERAFWLFAQGTRLADLRRMVRDYGRNQADLFPTGTYPKGGTYGTDMNFAVPDLENQNPNYSGGITCLDRNA